MSKQEKQEKSFENVNVDEIDVSELRDEILVNINEALYNKGAGSINLYGRSIPIQRHEKGMRYVDIGRIRFIQQNRWKGTQYAQRIAQGDKITWGIPLKGADRPHNKWIRIINNEVTR